MSAFELQGHRVACSRSAASRSAFQSLSRLTERYQSLKISPRAINLYPDQLNSLRTSLKCSGYDVVGRDLSFGGFILREVAR